MSGIGIITNPHSKLNKRNPERPALLGYILGEQGRLEITESLKDLSRAAEHFKNSKIEILAINGGDGTISQTLTAFINVYRDDPMPKIALLRGGTMNVISQSLGMTGSPERLLYRLVDGYSSEISWNISSLRTLLVRNQYGFLYADGIATTVLEEFYKRKSNAVGAIWLLAKIILSNLFNTSYSKRLIKAKKVDLSFEPMKTVLSENSLGVFAASIERMPLGARLFPEGQKDSSRFQFFSVRSKAKGLVYRLPLLMLKNQIQSNNNKYSDVCSSIEIKRDGPFPYTLDGELFTAEDGHLKIGLGPKLDFIVF